MANFSQKNILKNQEEHFEEVLYTDNHSNEGEDDHNIDLMNIEVIEDISTGTFTE